MRNRKNKVVKILDNKTKEDSASSPFFNKTNFVNKIRNSGRVTESNLLELCKLNNFFNEIKYADLSFNQSKIVSDTKEAIEFVNKNYDNAFGKYSKKDNNTKVVKGVYDDFSKHRKINSLDHLLSDIKSNVSYLSDMKRTRKYHQDFLKVKSQYNSLKEMFGDLLEMENIQEHEIRYIVEKEKEIDGMVKKSMIILEKLERKKVAVYVSKVIITVTLLASLVLVGR